MLNGLKLADNNNLNYYLEIYLNKENIDINNITKFIHTYLNENYENIIYKYIYSNIYIDYLKKDINFDNYNNNILNNIHLIQNNEYDKFIKKYDKYHRIIVVESITDKPLNKLCEYSNVEVFNESFLG